jgi:hypothetical protein
MSVIAYEYNEFEGVANSLKEMPSLKEMVMNNAYVKKYNSKPMPEQYKYSSEDAIERLLWYMYVANRVAYSLQYQENTDIFTTEQKAEVYTPEQSAEKFSSFMYNIYTNSGNVFLSDDWLGLGKDIQKFLKKKFNMDYEAGGTLPTPFGQAGLVGETGAMNEMELFAMGGGLPQGVHQFYANTYNPAYPTPHGYAKGGYLEGKTYYIVNYFSSVSDIRNGIALKNKSFGTKEDANTFLKSIESKGGRGFVTDFKKPTREEIDKLDRDRNENYMMAKGGSTYQGGGEIDYANQTSDDFKLGELVYDTTNKRYGTIIGIYNETKYEVRLDSDGMQPTEYLRKLGEKEDKGTKKQLFEAVSSIERLQRDYPENNYPKLINNPFYAKGGKTKSSGSKRQTPMSLAKEIRKEGEKWQDAVKRASAMLKKK